MLQNVLYFQMLLGIGQIVKPTATAAVIQGVVGWLLWFLPGVFPGYKRLRRFRGRVFKRVKCVVPSKGKSQNSTGASKPQAKSQNSTGASNPEAESISVHYLGETFVVKREGNKVSVNGEMSCYISDRQSDIQWKKICQMQEKCFKKRAGKGSEKENEVVFVKGCRFIWPKVATGEIMEFEEVLDDLMLEKNNTLLISNNVWFLPLGLTEKPKDMFPKFFSLYGLILSTRKKPYLVLGKFFSIVSAILELYNPLRSRVYWIINKMFCWSVHTICNKLHYPVRRLVYLCFIWVENLMPRNDILLKVERRDNLDVVIGGSAKINSAQEATHVDWLDAKEEYEFRCGCPIVMKATYNDVTRKCTATMQHTNAVFCSTEKRVFLKCPSPDEFMRIGTFLSCLATSKAGSLFKYDRNDNIVHVRGWRESLRHYVDAGCPKIYKLTLHDVIV